MKFQSDLENQFENVMLKIGYLVTLKQCTIFCTLFTGRSLSLHKMAQESQCSLLCYETTRPEKTVPLGARLVSKNMFLSEKELHTHFSKGIWPNPPICSKSKPYCIVL